MYWLLKSEPDVFSWEMCKDRGPKGEPWTGVRNYQARNNMRAMARGDLGFFYHSNEGREVVGIVRVIGLAHADPDDDTAAEPAKAVCDVCAVRELCLEYALGYREKEGVWGGATERERRRIIRQRRRSA